MTKKKRRWRQDKNTRTKHLFTVTEQTRQNGRQEEKKAAVSRKKVVEEMPAEDDCKLVKRK